MKATTYLTLAPTFGRWHDDPIGFKVVKATTRKPSTPGVVIAITIDVPQAAFMPLRPIIDVVIDVPDVAVIVDVEPPEESS